MYIYILWIPVEFSLHQTNECHIFISKILNCLLLNINGYRLKSKIQEYSYYISQVWCSGRTRATKVDLRSCFCLKFSAPEF